MHWYSCKASRRSRATKYSAVLFSIAVGCFADEVAAQQTPAQPPIDPAAPPPALESAPPPPPDAAPVIAPAAPAAPPATALQQAGRDAFLAHRCDACHTVRGVGEASQRGPDLTHVGSRPQLGAGALPNTQEARQRWIAHVQQLKSGARMPSYERIDGSTLEAMADWLGSLR